MGWRMQLDDRQRKEVEFDILYAQEFNHGTDGHNARLIIAKLAFLLDQAAAGAHVLRDLNDKLDPEGRIIEDMDEMDKIISGLADLL